MGAVVVELGQRAPTGLHGQQRHAPVPALPEPLQQPRRGGGRRGRRPDWQAEREDGKEAGRPERGHADAEGGLERGLSVVVTGSTGGAPVLLRAEEGVEGAEEWGDGLRAVWAEGVEEDADDGKNLWPGVAVAAGKAEGYEEEKRREGHE